MNIERPRVRFAPSPSGSLHVGNARTALFNWLFARRYGGDFILRIEDTDQERTRDVFISNLQADLSWLGLDWDEGPGKEGAAGPYYQSQRLDIYLAHLESLKNSNRVYPCYCTEEELEAERKALQEKRLMPRYLGRCRDLSPEERSRREGEGRAPSYRFRVQEGTAEFEDLIRSHMKFDCRGIGDFIIFRSNGIPAYNFAVVIDDHLMGITHVIRGEDHLSNTAAQILLYRALGLTPPVFAHHALILGTDRAKLSKRHGAASVGDFRERGILPEALLNYLSLMGGNIIKGQEIQPLETIIENFSLDELGKGGAIFDEAKLRWMNGMYIHRERPEELLERLHPFILRAGFDPAALDQKRLLAIVSLVQDNLATLADIGDYLDIFLAGKWAPDSEGAEIIRETDSIRVLAGLKEALEDLNSDDDFAYTEVIGRVRAATGFTGRKLLLPIRAALTGRLKGPDLPGIFSLLGKEAIASRIKAALNA